MRTIIFFYSKLIQSYLNCLHICCIFDNILEHFFAAYWTIYSSIFCCIFAAESLWIIVYNTSTNLQVNDEEVDVLQKSHTVETQPVQVPDFNIGENDSLADTEFNVGDLEFLAAAEFNIGDFENVVAADFNVDEFENMAVEMHMNASEEFQAFTDESDEEADVDDSDSEDPDFRIAVWESSKQSESFGSFVDEEVE